MLFRSILFQLGMWIFTIPFTLLSLLTFPAPPMYRYKFISLWAKTMLIWLKWTCNISFIIKGSANIPKSPFIILSKHQSAWETLAFQKIFPPQVWVMKRELLFVPFFGWGLAMTSPIAIDRSLGKKSLNQMLKQGLDRLKKSFCIVIFPEGLVPTENVILAPFNNGAFSLGIEYELPIVPQIYYDVVYNVF